MASTDANFNAQDPNHWITVATALAALFVQLAPIIAQLFQTPNQPKQG